MLLLLWNCDHHTWTADASLPTLRQPTTQLANTLEHNVRAIQTQTASLHDPAQIQVDFTAKWHEACNSCAGTVCFVHDANMFARHGISQQAHELRVSDKKVPYRTRREPIPPSDHGNRCMRQGTCTSQTKRAVNECNMRSCREYEKAYEDNAQATTK